MIAHATGIELDEITTTWDKWVTPNERKTAEGDIAETVFRFTDGSGRDPAAAGCLTTGMRALNAVPAVNDLPPGWVTPLDLPLIAGQGTIR